MPTSFQQLESGLNTNDDYSDTIITPKAAASLDRAPLLGHAPSRVHGSAPPGSLWIPRLLCILVQAAFATGSVFLKSRLAYIQPGERFHPIVYAFGREIFSGPILYAVAYFYSGARLPARRDIVPLAGLGLCIYGSQLFYILGIKLSGVVVATCMQPTIPVFTVMLSILLGLEKATPQLILGVVVAVVGSICMVMGGATSHGTTIRTAAESHTMLVGNLCLVVNTFAMAFYYIIGKTIVGRYPATAVVGWSYMFAATLMGLSAAAFTSPEDWNFPKSLILPLIYWILVCSVSGYGILTWAMTKLPSSQVASFQCTQPLVGTILALLVLHEMPNWWDLGAFGIIGGLFLVTYGGSGKKGPLLVAPSATLQLSKGMLRKSRSFTNLISSPVKSALKKAMSKEGED